MPATEVDDQQKATLEIEVLKVIIGKYLASTLSVDYKEKLSGHQATLNRLSSLASPDILTILAQNIKSRLAQMNLAPSLETALLLETLKLKVTKQEQKPQGQKPQGQKQEMKRWSQPPQKQKMKRWSQLPRLKTLINEFWKGSLTPEKQRQIKATFLKKLTDSTPTIVEATARSAATSTTSSTSSSSTTSSSASSPASATTKPPVPSASLVAAATPTPTSVANTSPTNIKQIQLPLKPEAAQQLLSTRKKYFEMKPIYMHQKLTDIPCTLHNNSLDNIMKENPQVCFLIELKKDRDPCTKKNNEDQLYIRTVVDIKEVIIRIPESQNIDDTVMDILCIAVNSLRKLNNSKLNLDSQTNLSVTIINSNQSPPAVHHGDTLKRHLKKILSIIKKPLSEDQKESINEAFKSTRSYNSSSRQTSAATPARLPHKRSEAAAGAAGTETDSTTAPKSKRSKQKETSLKPIQTSPTSSVAATTCSSAFFRSPPEHPLCTAIRDVLKHVPKLGEFYLAAAKAMLAVQKNLPCLDDSCKKSLKQINVLFDINTSALAQEIHARPDLTRQAVGHLQELLIVLQFYRIYSVSKDNIFSGLQTSLIEVSGDLGCHKNPERDLASYILFRSGLTRDQEVRTNKSSNAEDRQLRQITTYLPALVRRSILSYEANNTLDTFDKCMSYLKSDDSVTGKQLLKWDFFKAYLEDFKQAPMTALEKVIALKLALAELPEGKFDNERTQLKICLISYKHVLEFEVTQLELVCQTSQNTCDSSTAASPTSPILSAS